MAGLGRKCAALLGAAAAVGAYRLCRQLQEEEVGDSVGWLAGGRLRSALSARRLLSGERAFASFTNNFEPSVRWDNNWDRREPASVVRPQKGPEDKERYEKALKEAEPKFSRHLLLVRHSQYADAESDAGRELTELGWEQADLTGQRLSHLGLQFDSVHYSTMKRARQTAEAILRHLPVEVAAEPTQLLEEGAPVPPEPPAQHYRPSADTFHRDGARIETAFRRFFHRADPAQAADTHELLVCHGNVIRYFVCRALQLPPEAWLRFSVDHASITWVTIRPSGRVSIRYIGNSGHIPAEKCTYL